MKKKAILAGRSADADLMKQYLLQHGLKPEEIETNPAPTSDALIEALKAVTEANDENRK